MRRLPNEGIAEINEAASGTREVSSIIATVQKDAERTRNATGEIQSAAGDVGNRASELERAVESFVKAVAAA